MLAVLALWFMSSATTNSWVHILWGTHCKRRSHCDFEFFFVLFSLRIVLKDGILKKFVNSARNLTAEERGKLLEEDNAFMQTMNTNPMPATDESCSTSSDGADLHFVALIEKNGQLYELDGLKSFPISHGPTTKETFVKVRLREKLLCMTMSYWNSKWRRNSVLQDAARVCREFAARDPSDIHFTVNALTEKQNEHCSLGVWTTIFVQNVWGVGSLYQTVIFR